MFWVVGGLWRVGGGQGRGGWIKESVNLVSVGGWVCVCVGVLSVGLGPGLDSMSPARSRRSASHAAGTHGWLPQKTGEAGPPERRGRWIQFAQCSPEQSPRLWHCGTPTTSRLYPFGAWQSIHPHHHYNTILFRCYFCRILISHILELSKCLFYVEQLLMSMSTEYL